jgi:hypothetical protein
MSEQSPGLKAITLIDELLKTYQEDTPTRAMLLDIQAALMIDLEHWVNQLGRWGRREKEAHAIRTNNPGSRLA